MDKISFSLETIFHRDYQAEQLVLRNIHLYPTPFFARVFQNKPRIYFYKYASNFFALTDPNYYFFASHPQPLYERINFYKFPFLAIIFFIAGIFTISTNKYNKLVLWTFVPMVLILSSLKNFEGFDFMLYFPVSLVLVHGINFIDEKRKVAFTYLSAIYILYATTEVIRGFYNL